MRFSELTEKLASCPVFRGTDLEDVSRQQIQRWVEAGQLLRVHRGVYCLSESEPTSVQVANALLPGSYVSGLSALALHGMVNRAGDKVLSVSSRRAVQFDTPLGAFVFRRLVKPSAGAVVDGVASPERALLDLLRLEPQSDQPGFLRSLRLRDLQRLDLGLLRETLRQKPALKLRRALARAVLYCEADHRRHQ